MNKVLMFLCVILIGSTLHASYSNDEYIDSLGVPQIQYQETRVYHADGGKSLIRSSPYGGSTVYHSDGSRSLVNSNYGGGTIYHSDGSKSVYSNSGY